MPGHRIQIACLIALAVSAFSAPLNGQTLTVLHSFSVSDGAIPRGGLVMDPEGNLYGTTTTGGGFGHGSIYKVDSSGNTTVLHSFTNHEGAGSDASLVLDKAGNLYGTNYWGGGEGVGTVFKLEPSGKLIVLHTFNKGAGYDCANPLAPLIRDDAGNLYGTTANGGRYQSGCIYEIDHRAGTEKVLYSFTGLSDGRYPSGPLLRDSTGILYGTTDGGGAFGSGVVFKLDTSGTETVLYSFGEITNDGDGPTGGLAADAEGNLYSTTNTGGSYEYGTVFKLNPSNMETVLYSFTASEANPAAGVTRNSKGDLYGTTVNGGGSIYEIDSLGNWTLQHLFVGTDGSEPFAGVIRDAAGNLYGTTAYGGDYGYGVVYKFTPATSPVQDVDLPRAGVRK